jgi:hypothetical protein
MQESAAPILDTALDSENGVPAILPEMASRAILFLIFLITPKYATPTFVALARCDNLRSFGTAHFPVSLRMPL